jgi:hypothetical protein
MNFKIIVLCVIFLFSFCLNLNAQKPKKIFNYLQENQLSLAVEEYNKISSDKDYDNDDKVLFAYAKCLFQIDTNYQKYNPNQAIKEYNGTYILSDIKESVYKFLGKYTLSPEVINQKIINEIYREAIKLNTVESYSNALNYYSKEHNDNTVKLLEIATYNRVKSDKAISQLKGFITKYPESIYKTEIQNLLERETLNNYKSINNIDSLNQFISQFNSSIYKPEAVDFRDSLVLSTVLENYESLLTFTKKYPDSKFKTEVDNRLPDVLYKEIVKDSSNFNKIILFANKYPYSTLKKDVEKIYFSQLINSFELIRFQQYFNIYKNGYYKNEVLKIITNQISNSFEVNDLKKYADLVIELKDVRLTYYYLYQIMNLKTTDYLKNQSVSYQTDFSNINNKEIYFKIIKDMPHLDGAISQKFEMPNYSFKENTTDTITKEIINFEAIKEFIQLFKNSNYHFDISDLQLELIDKWVNSETLEILASSGSQSSIAMHLFLIKNNSITELYTEDFRKRLNVKFNQINKSKYPNLKLNFNFNQIFCSNSSNSDFIYITSQVFKPNDCGVCSTLEFKIKTVVRGNKLEIVDCSINNK